MPSSPASRYGQLTIATMSPLFKCFGLINVFVAPTLLIFQYFTIKKTFLTEWLERFYLNSTGTNQFD